MSTAHLYTVYYIEKFYSNFIDCHHESITIGSININKRFIFWRICYLVNKPPEFDKDCTFAIYNDIQIIITQEALNDPGIRITDMINKNVLLINVFFIHLKRYKVSLAHEICKDEDQPCNFGSLLVYFQSYDCCRKLYWYRKSIE